METLVSKLTFGFFCSVTKETRRRGGGILLVSIMETLRLARPGQSLGQAEDIVGAYIVVLANRDNKADGRGHLSRFISCDLYLMPPYGRCQIALSFVVVNTNRRKSLVHNNHLDNKLVIDSL